MNRHYLVRFLTTDLKQNKRNNKKKSRQMPSYLKPGCNVLGTLGNRVPTPSFGAGTRSHTFLRLTVMLLEDLDFSFQFLRAADCENRSFLRVTASEQCLVLEFGFNPN